MEEDLPDIHARSLKSPSEHGRAIMLEKVHRRNPSRTS
uniref:Uncharacterized protein n=2 Tax=Anguilla anguilla TaxID=7936 RepID=A0A0E9SH86_ANGAN